MQLAEIFAMYVSVLGNLLRVYVKYYVGVIAQLGERLNGIQEVRSSILLSSTN